VGKRFFACPPIMPIQRVQTIEPFAHPTGLKILPLFSLIASLFNTTQRDTMQISIDLPNDFVVLQSVKDIEHDMRLSYALWLFKNAKITLSKAAELTNMDIYAFDNNCFRVGRGS
jgi:hypothetical protein